MQLSFELGPRDPELAGEVCLECGAISVTLVDARDDAVLEPLPGEVRLWPATRVQSLFPPGADPGRAADALSATLGIGLGDIEATWIEDRAWEREWLKDFHALRFGKRLWICPSHEPVTTEEAITVQLDPGLAFGTGTHPTTALCLEWLDGSITGSEHLIDYGCGSGILAIAAVKLGARHAHCFDIDPQALLATQQNALANGVESRIIVHQGTDTLPEAVELLLANILSGPLCALARTFGPRIHPGGRIVLAGLLDHQAGDVTEAYSPWFDMTSFGSREGWVGLAGKRRSPVPRS